jgi:hypothetical protein
VYAHANAELAGGQRRLPRRNSVGCLREGIEEGVSLCVDLDTAVVLEGIAKQPPMLAQGITVPFTELLHETG